MSKPTPYEHVGRAEFLLARIGYLATLRKEGCSHAEMMSDCNLVDEAHVMALLDTVDRAASGRWPNEV